MWRKKTLNSECDIPQQLKCDITKNSKCDKTNKNQNLTNIKKFKCKEKHNNSNVTKLKIVFFSKIKKLKYDSKKKYVSKLKKIKL